MSEYRFRVLHLFSGIGGGALGFDNAREDYMGLRGSFETLGGIDVDPLACEDFTRLVGVPATCLDLFSRADYTAWHGHEPPADWHEATPADIRAAAQNRRPDVVFLSPPCKGLSSLLPAAQAESPKYQALNHLTVRGIALMLAAWPNDVPGLVILENVPRITSGRGAALLANIEGLLTSAGYVLHRDAHDLGEVGELSQHRRRFLLVARHPDKVMNPLFRPPQKTVHPIKRVLADLPMPDDPAGGKMHTLPRLNWMTWVRLALIPAGGDWRDLQQVEPGSFGIEPAAAPLNHTFRVTPWDGPAGTVTGAHSPSNGCISVAEPRLPGRHWDGHFKVVGMGSPAPTITAQASNFGSNSATAIADTRLQHLPRRGVYKVARWTEPASTVVASASVRGSNGVAAVSDPRVRSGFSNKYKVLPWNRPATTVTGMTDIQEGAQSVADPREAARVSRRSGQLAVRGWHDPAMTVTGEDSVGSGAQSVADPRLSPHLGDGFKGSPGLFGLLDWEEPASVVTASAAVSSGNGKAAVADPRLRRALGRPGGYGILRWGKPSPTVRGVSRIMSSPSSVQDPRLGCSPRSGAYQVLEWEEPSTTVTAAGDVHAQGASAVSDPRPVQDPATTEPARLPGPKDKGVWIILAEDGTWHRPLTTLELAVLQGFPAVLPDGRPLELAGRSQSTWREHIGNAVPPPAAEAIGRAMLLALVPSRAGVVAWNVLMTALWVKSLAQRIRAFRPW